MRHKEAKCKGICYSRTGKNTQQCGESSSTFNTCESERRALPHPQPFPGLRSTLCDFQPLLEHPLAPHPQLPFPLLPALPIPLSYHSHKSLSKRRGGKKKLGNTSFKHLTPQHFAILKGWLYKSRNH